MRLGGMAQGLKIEGVGPVTWTFCNPDGSEMNYLNPLWLIRASAILHEQTKGAFRLPSISTRPIYVYRMPRSMQFLHHSPDTGLENMVDPRVYAAKSPGSDPDMATFHQTENGEYADEWVKAMQLEVATLVQQHT